MLVGNRMSRPVITVYPETSMKDALERMNQERIRRLPVVNKRGQLVGIVSENQLLRAYPSDATSLSKWEISTMVSKITIEKVMTKDVITVDEDTVIEDAARIMEEGNFSSLPVMREGKLVGMITEGDLYNVCLEVLGAREPGIRLTVNLEKKQGKLAAFTRAISDAGGNILSLGTFLGSDSEHGNITAKIEGIDKKQLIKVIKPVVEKIVDIR